MSEPSQQVIGHVVGTEQSPNTAYKFHFWAELSAPLGIGSLVRVEYGRGEGPAVRIYGVVVEAYAYNDLPNALTDYLGREGTPGGEALTLRPEIRVYEAAVLRRIPEEPVAAVGIGEVYEATAADVRTALCGDKFEGGIPIGFYGMKGKELPVYADPDYILGPEAGHFNITGTSGLAAKTSYIQFLLSSVFQHYEGRGDQGIAGVMFNVKGGDLLYLDHAWESPDDASARMYGQVDIPVAPFQSVTYYAPYQSEAHSGLVTLRRHPDLDTSNPTHGFCFGLNTVLQNADVLLSREDLDAKADSFLAFLQNEVVGRDWRVEEDSAPLKVDSLFQLIEAVKQMLAKAEEGRGDYHSHHSATIRKMYNRLEGFRQRFSGLIASQTEEVPPLPARFEDRHVYVVDVAQCSADAQDLIFAAVISELRNRMEEGNLGVRRLIVVVDELNKYAPSGGRETHVMRSLRDIAARGRYLGLVLFSAQQFRSRVDPQIVGNCANSAFGNIQLEELTHPTYTVYPPAVREKLATADPGELMVRHPHFSQPLFIRFPLPTCLRGTDGMRKFPVNRQSLEDEIMRVAKSIDPHIAPAVVRDLLAAVPVEDRESRLRRILEGLAEEKRNEGRQVKEVIQRCGGRAQEMKAGPPVPVADPEDPFS